VTEQEVRPGFCTIRILFFDPVPEPAEKYGRLDIPYGETVPEPYYRFPARCLKRDLIHVYDVVGSGRVKRMRTTPHGRRLDRRL
jgi:hypothetical protein